MKITTMKKEILIDFLKEYHKSMLVIRGYEPDYEDIADEYLQSHPQLTQSAEEILNKIYNELKIRAYNKSQHTYDYKCTNQIIRKHFELLMQEYAQQLSMDEKSILDLIKKAKGIQHTFSDEKLNNAIDYIKKYC